MIGFLTDRGENCCSYCGARDHGYETCSQFSAMQANYGSTSSGEPNLAVPVDFDPEPYRPNTLPGCDPRRGTLELRTCTFPVNQKVSFHCSYCGTSRLDINPETGDSTEVNCTTCSRPMGTWYDIKREFYRQEGEGIFSVEHGQFFRLDEFAMPSERRNSSGVIRNGTEDAGRHYSSSLEEHK